MPGSALWRVSAAHERDHACVPGTVGGLQLVAAAERPRRPGGDGQGDRVAAGATGTQRAPRAGRRRQNRRGPRGRRRDDRFGDVRDGRRGLFDARIDPPDRWRGAGRDLAGEHCALQRRRRLGAGARPGHGHVSRGIPAGEPGRSGLREDARPAADRGRDFRGLRGRPGLRNRAGNGADPEALSRRPRHAERRGEFRPRQHAALRQG
jgi:hypothetical protein